MNTHLVRPLNVEEDAQHFPPDHMRSFVGLPQKRVFSVGTRFYRFITPQRGDHCGNHVLVGNFWFGESMWSRLCRLSFKSRRTLIETARNRFAVTRAFNREMEYLCGIILCEPVCGWVGKARCQIDEEARARLPGGFEQVYFPSLGANPNNNSTPYARMCYWAAIEGQ